jgi:hypothetical protein
MTVKAQKQQEERQCVELLSLNKFREYLNLFNGKEVMISLQPIKSINTYEEFKALDGIDPNLGRVIIVSDENNSLRIALDNILYIQRRILDGEHEVRIEIVLEDNLTVVLECWDCYELCTE